MPSSFEPSVPVRPESMEDVYPHEHADEDHNWVAAVGSDPDLDPSNPAVDEVFEATYVVQPEPSMNVVWGWIWINGSRPRVRTKRVKAWSDGTAIIVQDRKTTGGDHVERVVFMEKTGAHILKVEYDGNEYTLTQANQYFEVVNNDTPVIASVSQSSEIQAVVAAVNDAVDDLGLP